MTHWVRRVSQVLHSSDRINADTAVVTLEGNCRFGPLKLKLGRMKRQCTDMGTLMAALVKYADSDSTKDPESDDDKTGKGKRNSNSKGQQHHWASNGGGGKRKADGNMDFVANTNAQDNGQRRKGRPKNHNGAPNPNPNRLNYLLSQPVQDMGRRRRQQTTFGRIALLCRSSRILIISGMITNLAVAQGPGRVTVEEVPVQDLMVIRAGIMVKIVRTTRVVTTNNSNSQVTRATQRS